MKKVFLVVALFGVLQGCASMHYASEQVSQSVDRVPNYGFPSNTYGGYPNESHDAD